MSLCLALHAGRYVMLASDTRTTMYNRAGDVVSYADGRRKIFASASTVIVGTGLVPLLDDVGRRITASPLQDPADVLEIIHEERERVRHHPTWPKRSIEQGLYCTNWFLSACVPTDDGSQLVLLSYLAGVGHTLTMYGPGSCAPIVPHADDDPEGLALFTNLLRYCQVCAPSEDVEKSIAFNAQQMRTIIAVGARRYPSVSPTSVVGVHRADGRTAWLGEAECQLPEPLVPAGEPTVGRTSGRIDATI